MASLKEIRSTLITLSKQIKDSLKHDSRTANILPARKWDRKLRNFGTNGYWIGLGRLTKSISVELWIDHYPDLSLPRAWFGFSSRSRKEIGKFNSLAPEIGFSKKIIKRSTRDVSSKPFYHFTRQLLPDEFDVIVHESYHGVRYYYLGIYAPYPWPFSRKHINSLIMDITNFIGCFGEYSDLLQKKRRIQRHGPWARPDKKTEKAAIRIIRKILKDHGYKVKSRENEICGYDLHAIRDRKELHVEVKGTSGSVPRFFISRTERKAAREDPLWRLVIVTSALSIRPKATRYLTGTEFERVFSLNPTEWEANPKS